MQDPSLGFRGSGAPGQEGGKRWQVSGPWLASMLSSPRTGPVQVAVMGLDYIPALPLPQACVWGPDLTGNVRKMGNFAPEQGTDEMR